MPTRLFVRLVEACRSNAWVVVLIVALAAALSAVYAGDRLQLDTDTEKLMSPDLPWRRSEAELDRKFPQRNDIVVVVDAMTPERADAAAEALAGRLAPRTELFTSVSVPELDPFFRKNGLLFMPPEEAKHTVDALVEAQPFIGSLAGDPTLRGLFKVLGQMADAVAAHAVDAAQVGRPFESLARAAASAVDEKPPRPVSWRLLMTDDATASRSARQLVLLQPVLDYTALRPGEAATAAVREAAHALHLDPDRGFSVRLTGSVPIADDEFSTLAGAMGQMIILTLGLFTGLMLFALRSVRLVAAILTTILAGLLITAGFAASTVGSLNPISVAFAVLFIGLAVDFGIQYTVRFRDERYHADDLRAALERTAVTVSQPLLLAGIATAVGFFSFLPTDYAGVRELGLIAGVGMIIALVLTFTFLPALLTLIRPAPAREPPGWSWAAGADAFVGRNRRRIALAAALVAAACAIVSLRLTFDADPLHLKNPKSESIATLRDLAADPRYSLDRLYAIVPSVADADATAARLEKLHSVGDVMTLTSFIPDHQDETLALIEDARPMLMPPLDRGQTAQPPSDTETKIALSALVAKLRALPDFEAAHRLADALDRAAQAGAIGLAALREVLLDGVPQYLESIRDLLQADHVTRESLPATVLRDWVAPDSAAKIEIQPRGDVNDIELRRNFVAEVRGVLPNVTGVPVSVLESGRTVVDAFRTAGLATLISITLVLAVVLRSFRAVAIVFAPLLLATLMTIATMVVFSLPLNHANIIALPLLIAIGVAFDIYFVMNWRAGVGGLLQTSTARAVVFSALTTATAFGSLAFSPHPGTADMGALLLIALGYTVFCTLFVLPALLGPPLARRDAAKV